MKKLVILFAVLMLMSVSVFAGPYFSVETTMGIITQTSSNTLGFGITPVITGGYDFSTVIQSEDGVLGPRIFGDTHFAFPVNDLSASLGAGFSGARIEVGTLLDFNRGLSKIKAWNTSFTVTGYPSTGLKLWGELSFNYNYGNPTSGWTLVPVLGVEGRW